MAISFSGARQHLKAVLDRVEADADVTLITRRHAKGAVVMSLHWADRSGSDRCH
jgi:antitoxin YefM